MDKRNITIDSLMNEYRIHKNELNRRIFKEFDAINNNDLLKHDMTLMDNLQTETSKNYSDYVNKYLDTQEHSGNPVSDISIDRETISRMTDTIADLIRTDYDYIDEIILNKDENANNGIAVFDIFNSFIRTLLLTELFLNRRINYDINYQNIPPESPYAGENMINSKGR